MFMRENSKFINDFYSAFNNHNIRRMIEFYSESAILNDISLSGSLRGKEEIRTRFQEYFTAFPDFSINLTNMISTGNWIICEWHANGTHRSTWAGIPPTFNTVSVSGVSLFNIKDRHIQINNIYWDFYKLLKQIGFIEFPFLNRMATWSKARGV